MITFDRTIYFDKVRKKPFGGSMTQPQIDGQEAILSAWECGPGIADDADQRHLAYALATAFHETAQEMQPIEEHGKGEGTSYGRPDPETGQTYYGRGYVQLTWRDNYHRASAELALSSEDDLEWHADKALDPDIAADVMFRGMAEGWFRSSDGKPETLDRYFSDTVDDPFGAREIINGDKDVVPGWSNGVSIGRLVEGYHADFLAALDAATIEPPVPDAARVTLDIGVPSGVSVEITLNGELVWRGGAS